MALFLEKMCWERFIYIVYVSDGPIISGLNWLIEEKDKNKYKTNRKQILQKH